MNLRPPGYEPGELPDCSTPHRYVAPTSPARSAFKQEKRQERILPVCLNERKSFLSDSQGLHVFNSIESELLTLDGAASLAAYMNTSHALSHPILGVLLINASLRLLDILLAIAAVTHVVLGIFEREHARLLLANPLLERRLVSGTHTQHMTANNTRHHSQSVAVTPAICAIRYAAAGKNIMSDVASPVW